MTQRIDDEQLPLLSDLVTRHFGLHFPTERWADLERGVCEAARESGFLHQPDEYIQEILSPAPTQRNLETLIRFLTVGETYFFREKRSLDAFEHEIVPELLRTRASKEIKVWSAGCCTGEEPYSIAMTLHKLRLEHWSIKVLGTDLDTKSLEKAATGIYGEWSFRGTTPLDRTAYFDAADGKNWAVRSEIKRMVSFAQHNLADGFPPPPPFRDDPFDVIFCRNVLMYFSPENRKNIVRRLSRCLSSDGWLIVSPAETSHQLFSEFATVSLDGVTLYRKSKTPLPTKLTAPLILSEEHGFGGELAQPVLPHSTVRALSAEPQGHPEKAEPTGKHEAIAQAMFLRAQAYANEGNLTPALNYCDKAIAADRMASRSYYLRATILQEQGALPEALCSLKQTIYVEPQFVLAHLSLGSLTLTQGKRKESERHFKNALLLLAQYEPEDVVPESGGLSAGRLKEMIISERGAAIAGATRRNTP